MGPKKPGKPRSLSLFSVFLEVLESETSDMGSVYPTRKRESSRLNQQSTRSRLHLHSSITAQFLSGTTVRSTRTSPPWGLGFRINLRREEMCRGTDLRDGSSKAEA